MPKVPDIVPFPYGDGRELPRSLSGQVGGAFVKTLKCVSRCRRIAASQGSGHALWTAEDDGHSAPVHVGEMRTRRESWREPLSKLRSADQASALPARIRGAGNRLSVLE